MKIIVDSKYNMQYCGFYLQGLYQLFGWENIRFDHKPYWGFPKQYDCFFCGSPEEKT